MGFVACLYSAHGIKERPLVFNLNRKWNVYNSFVRQVCWSMRGAGWCPMCFFHSVCCRNAAVSKVEEVQSGFLMHLSNLWTVLFCVCDFYSPALLQINTITLVSLSLGSGSIHLFTPHSAAFTIACVHLVLWEHCRGIKESQNHSQHESLVESGMFWCGC